MAIRIFYEIADFLLLIHFTMDPYIYVLLRTNYWIRFKSFASRLLLRKEDDFAEMPKTGQDHQIWNLNNMFILCWETSGWELMEKYSTTKFDVNFKVNYNSNLFLLNKHLTMHPNIFNIFFPMRKEIKFSNFPPH